MSVKADILKSELSNKVVKLSVVIPYFRAGDCGWIPLESLARQEDVDFAWELIIIEEDFENPMGYDRIMVYADRLKNVGCARITYMKLYSWMPLATKWYYLFQQVDDTSIVVACNSADIYMSKHRLTRQLNALKSHEYNWHKVSGNIVYDISLNKHVKLVSMNPDRSDTCCAAISATLAKKLPKGYRRRGVDGWRYISLKQHGIHFYYDESDMWMDTVNINGLNNLSTDRQRRIIRTAPPFQTCCASLGYHVPIEILHRLFECRKAVPMHKQLIQASNIRI